MDQGFLDPIGRGGHGSMRLFQKYSSNIISHSGGVISILLEDIFRKKSYGMVYQSMVYYEASEAQAYVVLGGALAMYSDGFLVLFERAGYFTFD